MTWLVATALAAVLAMGGCGGSPSGDPGGQRLDALIEDDVFAALPPGAVHVRRAERSAVYREPAFQASTWDGPSLVVTFRSSAPPRAVFGFYGRRARLTGWTSTGSGRLGLTDTWAKTYADGAPARLSLSYADGVYRLAGSTAPAS